MKISVNNLKEGINFKHRKETHFYKSYSLVSFDPKQTGNFNKGFNEPLSVRFYGTSSTTYCCIWGNIKGVHFNGSGKAGGYGYDRSSAAFADALQSAGFEVSGLSATGQNELAIQIIAGLNELEFYTIVRAHS